MKTLTKEEVIQQLRFLTIGKKIYSKDSQAISQAIEMIEGTKEGRCMRLLEDLTPSGSEFVGDPDVTGLIEKYEDYMNLHKNTVIPKAWINEILIDLRSLQKEDAINVLFAGKRECNCKEINGSSYFELCNICGGNINRTTIL